MRPSPARQGKRIPRTLRVCSRRIARILYTGGMRRRYWAGSFVLAGMVLLLIIGLPGTEPSYQGKSLCAWLRNFESERLEARWQAADAVRHFGTNAVPFLTTQLRDVGPKNEPKWKMMLRTLLSKQSLINISVPCSRSPRTEALAAFDALGPLAKEAAPAIEQLLYETPPDPRAVVVLARMGPDAVPALTRALTNDEKVIRTGARVCLNMLESHSGILFPKTAQEAEFSRRNCEFNLLLMRSAFEEYRSQHPEQFLPAGPSSLPVPSLPPDYLPMESTETNSPTLAVPKPGWEFE